jgi:hypothetical protein
MKLIINKETCLGQFGGKASLKAKELSPASKLQLP